MSAAKIGETGREAEKITVRWSRDPCSGASLGTSEGVRNLNFN